MKRGGYSAIELEERVTRLRGQGLLYRVIAERLGVTIGHISVVIARAENRRHGIIGSRSRVQEHARA